MIEECKLKNGEKKEREIYYTKEWFRFDICASPLPALEFLSFPRC